MASTAAKKRRISGDSSGEFGDIFGSCLVKLPYDDLVRAKLVSKFFKDYVESSKFYRQRGRARSVEFSLTALHFFLEDGVWHCSGLELASGRWRRLPPLTYLPAPWAWQRNLIAASGGLFCINVSHKEYHERLIVCNPLTQENVVLPPLHHRRNPVLLHLLPNPATNSFKVIAAGSSSSEMDSNLSVRTEVFDSLSWKWTETGRISIGPEFCLNEYQTGVCRDGLLYCIGYLKVFERTPVTYIETYQKSLLAYNIEKGEGMRRLLCGLPIPKGKIAHIAQLVENNQDIFLFLEEATLREERPVQLIAKLETFADPEGKLVRWKWKTVMRKTIGQQSNCEEPEYTCVPYAVGKLCIFNNIKHRGVVYDVVKEREEEEEIPSPPTSRRRFFYHSLNPLSGSFQAGYNATCVPRHAAA